MTFDPIRISKFLSLVLRHEPQRAGLSLDASGWVEVDRLIHGCAAAGVPFTRAQLEDIVAQNDKQRFAFSPDGFRIRANQGHSVAIELDYAPAVPPDLLYHGTADRFLPSIREKGLVRGSRHHVHLTAVRTTATEVGRRHGRPVVITVAAGVMSAAGYAFFRSANGVWLTDEVPPAYLAFE